MRRLAAIAMLCGSLPAFGWGPEGHNLVARLAAAHLTPAAAARVAEILGPGITMQSISSWPDQIRRDRAATGPWHYVDIPIDKPHLDMARDCPKGDCVLAKIEDFRKALKDPATAPEPQREALMFLVHFVGDMHQPLHCADNADQGGNKVLVKYGNRGGDRPYNLHSLWDSGLLDAMPKMPTGAVPKEELLLPQYSLESARHAKKWSKGTVEDWAEQIHK